VALESLTILLEPLVADRGDFTLRLPRAASPAQSINKDFDI